MDDNTLMNVAGTVTIAKMTHNANRVATKEPTTDEALAMYSHTLNGRIRTDWKEAIDNLSRVERDIDDYQALKRTAVERVRFCASGITFLASALDDSGRMRMPVDIGCGVFATAEMLVANC